MRTLWVFIMLCCLPAQASYEQAVAAFQSGQFAQVLSVLDGLPREEAGRPAAQNLRSLALMKLARYEEALAANRTALRLDPSNPNYIYNTGMIELAKGDLTAAARTFGAALQVLPQSSRLHEGLGETLYAMSSFHDAEDAFRRAVELDGSSGSAQIALAKLYYVLGDRTNFEPAVLRAIRIAPDNYLGCYYYGKYLLEQKGRVAEAGKYYEKSCTLSPQFVEGLIAWGGILSREGHWAEASGVYERAQSIDPGSAQIYYLLSLAYRKLGRIERAQWALTEFNRHAKP